MALVECVECGARVSDQAETCPQCGFRSQSIRSKAWAVAAPTWGAGTLRHPFERLPPASLEAVLGAGIAATVILGLVLLLVIEQGPGFGPLAALVLAGSPDAAAEVLHRWSATDRLRIAFVAGFDFLFGVAWTNTMALACVWAARQTASARLAALGAPLAWLLWGALALDVPENGAYFRMVLGSVEQPWPALAALALYPRILIFTTALGYIVWGVAAVAARATR